MAKKKYHDEAVQILIDNGAVQKEVVKKVKKQKAKRKEKRVSKKFHKL